jgi:MinD superfamily P-loop ATPase
MIISVASGKGGTGKTTVATNFAVALADIYKTALLDCDVEEPNAHLFLNIDKRQYNLNEKVFLPVPQIDDKKCVHCGKCLEVCAYHALADIGKKILVFEELCHGCGGCSLLCPEGAIIEKNKQIGDIKGCNVKGLDFVFGTLSIGSVMAPPVIKKVKNHIKQDRLTIIDCPPGTSCPMINAVMKSDFCMLVTEPTPFGLNDLKLAVEVVRELEIPCGVIINRSQDGDHIIEKYLASEGIPILMKIPLDRRYAASYANGKLLIEDYPDFKAKFIETLKNIEKWVKA